MTRRPGIHVVFVLAGLLVLAGWAFAWAHAGDGDHHDSCAICHVRSERAAAVPVPSPLPALIPDGEDVAPSASPGILVSPSHPWSARAPPSGNVVSDA